MRSLSKRSQRRSWSPACAVHRGGALEPLEGRRLLSGNVSVSLTPSGATEIVGDNQSNHIVIVNIGTALFITGEDGTTINGGTAPVPFDSLHSRTIATGNGDDVVEFKLAGVFAVGLQGSLAIDTGNGADRVSMSGYSVPAGVSIDTGNGDDEVSVDRFGLVAGLGSMSIDTGNGDDEVYVSESHFNALAVSLGKGDDELGFGVTGSQLNTAVSATLDGGKGDDVLEHPGDLLVGGLGATIAGFETIVP